MVLEKARSKHADPRKEDGLWVCEFCGAESLDRDLFEEVGEMEDCLTRGAEAGAIPDQNDVMAMVDVQNARKWMESARKAFNEMQIPAEKVAAEMKRVGDSLTRAEFHWARGELHGYSEESC